MAAGSSSRQARRRAVVMTVGAVMGGLLFWYALQQVGTEALVEGIRRVGWGFLVILALAGARFLLRAQCWRLCLPPRVQLDLPHAFSAFLAGDAVGTVTPLGLLASEPTKLLLVRHRLATLDSLASLALENILYALSVVAMLAFGFALLLGMSAAPHAAWWIAVGTVAAATGVAGGAVVVLRTPRLLPLRTELQRFAATHPGRLATVFLLQLFFHALAVAETFVTLQWLLGNRSPTFAQAVVFETVNRLMTVAFKFVPFRIGVDEAAAGAIAPLLAVTSAAGVTLAVIRKARMLFWSGIGLILVATHPSRKSADENP